ncbi:MAG: hypothetical protein WDW38_006193 [Sanguina aurantia]
MLCFTSQEQVDVPAAAAPALSKNAQKKLVKWEKMEAAKLEKRASEKAAKVAGKGAMIAERKAAVAALSPEERKKVKATQRATLATRLSEASLLKTRMAASLVSGPRVVIDLDFEGKMSECDTGHLFSQLAYSYSANKSAVMPVHLHLTSFAGSVRAVAEKKSQGGEFTGAVKLLRRAEDDPERSCSAVESQSAAVTVRAFASHLSHQACPFHEDAHRVLNWQVTHSEQAYHECYKDRLQDLCVLNWQVTHSEQAYHEFYKDRLQDLVYLSAEAEEELDALDPAKVYIIGGLNLNSRAVLTVNHVFDILLQYYNEPDWKAVLDRVLPKRKLAGYQQGKEAAATEQTAAVAQEQQVPVHVPEQKDDLWEKMQKQQLQQQHAKKLLDVQNMAQQHTENLNPSQGDHTAGAGQHQARAGTFPDSGKQAESMPSAGGGSSSGGCQGEGQQPVLSADVVEPAAVVDQEAVGRDGMEDCSGGLTSGVKRKAAEAPEGERLS